MHYTERPDQRRTNKYRANRTGARPATVSDGTPGVYIRVHSPHGNRSREPQQPNHRRAGNSRNGHEMNPQIEALIALIGSLTRENRALRQALLAQGDAQTAMHAIFGGKAPNNSAIKNNDSNA